MSKQQYISFGTLLASHPEAKHIQEHLLVAAKALNQFVQQAKNNSSSIQTDFDFDLEEVALSALCLIKLLKNMDSNK